MPISDEYQGDVLELPAMPPLGERDFDVWQREEFCCHLAGDCTGPENCRTFWGEEEPDWWPEYDSVLDVGCGDGAYYHRLTARGEQYVGVDSSQWMVGWARAKHPNGVFKLGDICNLQFSDRSIDFVFCEGVLVNLPTLLEPLQELWRVADKWLYFNVWTGVYPRTTGWCRESPPEFLFKGIHGEFVRVWRPLNVRRAVEAVMKNHRRNSVCIRIVNHFPSLINDEPCERRGYLLRKVP